MKSIVPMLQSHGMCWSDILAAMAYELSVIVYFPNPRAVAWQWLTDLGTYQAWNCDMPYVSHHGQLYAGLTYETHTRVGESINKAVVVAERCDAERGYTLSSETRLDRMSGML